VTDNLITVIGELDIILALTQYDPDVQEACYNALNALRSHQERVVTREEIAIFVSSFGTEDAGWEKKPMLVIDPKELVDAIYALQLPKPGTDHIVDINKMIPTVEEIDAQIESFAMRTKGRGTIAQMAKAIHDYLTTRLKGASHE